jgi:hypothetical protein
MALRRKIISAAVVIGLIGIFILDEIWANRIYAQKHIIFSSMSDQMFDTLKGYRLARNGRKFNGDFFRSPVELEDEFGFDGPKNVSVHFAKGRLVTATYSIDVAVPSSTIQTGDDLLIWSKQRRWLPFDFRPEWGITANGRTVYVRDGKIVDR